METKTVTLRLPQDVADYITRNGDGHERYADVEIRGKFTSNEWKFLADSLNGSMVLDDFRFNKDALIAHNQDSQLYDGTAARWNVNLDELNKKCGELSASQTEALYRRVESFWNHPDTDLDAWANF